MWSELLLVAGLLAATGTTTPITVVISGSMEPALGIGAVGAEERGVRAGEAAHGEDARGDGIEDHLVSPAVPTLTSRTRGVGAG
jgi:hypothetical protein